MPDLIRPVESVRIAPTLIWVRFSDDSTVEVACPAALIGNPIAREIAELDRWRTRVRPRPPWQLIDAGEHDADLREMLAAMPEDDRYLSIEPGWYGLAAQCWRQLRRIDPTSVVGEVKQKFGELRIAALSAEGQIIARFGGPIGWARKQSLRTCEWCAGAVDSRAELTGPGRLMRLCPDCGDFRDVWERAWQAAG